MLFTRNSTHTALLFATILFAPAALAATEYDQDVTPDVIFGSGNSNGAFTTDRESGIELGLRAKIPYSGTTHSNGDGTYSYSFAEMAACNFSWHPYSCWNFEWAVNTDFDDSSGLLLVDLTYELGVDTDPGLGVSYYTLDPITPPAFFDHSFGNNLTANGGGAEAGNPADYLTLLTTNNVLQQSWRHQFLPVAYDPSIPGTYAVYLLARDSGGAVVARSDIQVLIEGAEPAGPWVACDGFQPPLDEEVALRKPNRVLPLRFNLFDGDGFELTGADISANPVLQVTFDGVSYSGDADLENVDTAGRGDDGNMFIFDDTYWGLNMKTKGLSPGHYTLSVVSGDATEYQLDPTCEVGVAIQ